MSQADSSQKLPSPDTAKWHLTNKQKLIANFELFLLKQNLEQFNP
jgi:hypothetical protein